MLNGAKITVTTSGKSIAGTIKIDLDDALLITGDSSNELYLKQSEDDFSNLPGELNYYKSGIYASSFGKDETSGNSGDMILSAKRMEISDKGVLSTSTSGGGDAGKIIINTDDLIVDSASISSESKGTNIGGNSGEISIHAESIHFLNGASISGNVHGSGNGGSIRIESDNSVIFEGEDVDHNISRITIETKSQNENAGNGGKLNIIAGGDVLFKDGSYISSITFGKGNAGDIDIQSNGFISFSGICFDKHLLKTLQNSFGFDRTYNSGGLYAIADSISNGGNGGNVNIKAKNLTLLDGCPIFVTSIGQGDGGNIRVKVDNQVTLQGALDEGFWTAAISSSVVPVGPDAIGGDSGDVYIHAKDITIKDGGYIGSAVSSIYGKKCGAADEVILIADDSIHISGVNPYSKDKVAGSSGIYVYSKEIIEDDTNQSGDSGSIFIKTRSLTLENGAKITVSTSGKSKAGNIDLNIDDTILIKGDSINEPVYFDNESNMPGGKNYYKSGIYASSFGRSPNSGTGGEISIQSKVIRLSDKGHIETLTNGGGSAGKITLNSDTLSMSNDARISSESATAFVLFNSQHYNLPAKL